MMTQKCCNVAVTLAFAVVATISGIGSSHAQVGTGAAVSGSTGASPAVDGSKLPAVVSDPDLARQAFVDALAAFERGLYGQAYDIWLPLARGGDPAAQRNVGHLFRFGLGRPQDFHEAVSWYRRAADAGLARAQANLAMMYLRGQGVEQDAETAAYWMAGAAVQGHAIAQYNLALLHLRGEGVPRNEVLAAGWLYRAAQAGHAGALEALGRIVPSLSGPLGPPSPPPDWPGPDRVVVPHPDRLPAVAAAPRATAPGKAATAAPPSAAASKGPSKTSDLHAAPVAVSEAAGGGQTTALQMTDNSPEDEPGLLRRLGRSLIEQTSGWLQTDQDTGFERRPAQ